MPLDPALPKVVCIRGTKHPVSTTTGDKSQITVVSCCSAGGYSMPPMVIYDRQNLKMELTKGEVSGTIYGLPKSGWMDSDLFNQWFTKHFLAYAPPTRPILLLLDGHSTHYNPVTIEHAAEEKVNMFCLPPHSSNRNQPLDKGCFGPLKQYWQQEYHDFLIQNPGRVVTRYDFSELFSRSWYKGMTMSNVVNGFKTTGIYPFNRNALLPPDVPDSPPVRPGFSERTGINFIPLFSPNPRRVTFEDDEVQQHSSDFTEEEMHRFSRCFEEGYDVNNPRYELWLSIYHAPNHTSFSTPQSLNPMVLRKTSMLSRILDDQPGPTSTSTSTSTPKTSACVLTSLENCKMLQQKVEDKMRKENEKLERKAEREEKKEEKQMEMMMKKAAKKNKKLSLKQVGTKRKTVVRGGSAQVHEDINGSNEEESETGSGLPRDVGSKQKTVVHGRSEEESEIGSGLSRDVGSKRKTVVRGRAEEECETGNGLPRNVGRKTVVRGRSAQDINGSNEEESGETGSGLPRDIGSKRKTVVCGRSEEESEIGSGLPRDVGKTVVHGRSEEESEAVSCLPKDVGTKQKTIVHGGSALSINGSNELVGTKQKTIVHGGSALSINGSNEEESGKTGSGLPRDGIINPICISKACGHARAVKWVQCNTCKRWYHQICVGYKRQKEFTCSDCSNDK